MLHPETRDKIPWGRGALVFLAQSMCGWHTNRYGSPWDAMFASHVLQDPSVVRDKTCLILPKFIFYFPSRFVGSASVTPCLSTILASPCLVRPRCCSVRHEVFVSLSSVVAIFFLGDVVGCGCWIWPLLCRRIPPPGIWTVVSASLPGRLGSLVSPWGGGGNGLGRNRDSAGRPTFDAVDVSNISSAVPAEGIFQFGLLRWACRRAAFSTINSQTRIRLVCHRSSSIRQCLAVKNVHTVFLG